MSCIKYDKNQGQVAWLYFAVMEISYRGVRDKYAFYKVIKIIKVCLKYHIICGKFKVVCIDMYKL